MTCPICGDECDLLPRARPRVVRVYCATCHRLEIYDEPVSCRTAEQWKAWDETLREYAT